jgi:hypothetical protein
MYDPCRVGEALRKHVYINLGTWHVYKHVCLRVWKVYQNTVLAGLFHHLYPNGRVSKHPRLTVVTEIFNLIRLAYREFKNDLDDALGAECTHLHTPCQLTFLLNLRDLCEFFIPTVRA